MPIKIHSLLAAAIALGSAPWVTEAAGQSYPEKPVRVLVGLAPGGGTDTVTRVMTQKLSDVFGQPFVVDNRPSAGGNVAGELAARAAPDGYTLLTVTPTHVVNPSLWRDVRYDAVKDFAPIVLMVYTNYVLSVRTSLPVTSVKELIALAKTPTQRLIYASTGIGSANHLSAELFKTMAGIDMVHVPYKGGAPALSALAEVEADYSTTTEIADALLQKADVPFRIGHHFASKLTDYGRAQGLKLHEIPYAEAARIYEADTKQALPLSETDLAEVISAEYMVFGRRGIGGPQLAEVNRMLSEERAKVAADFAWLKDRSQHLARAEAALDQAFAVLAGG